MTQQAFERMTEELLLATEALLKSELRLPGLLVLYAGIDILASLDRPQTAAGLGGGEFVEWADRYLMRGARLDCGPQDLYGARCTLFHAPSTESQAIDLRDAKQIWYAWGAGRKKDLQTLIDDTDDAAAVAVHVDELLRCFRRGVKLFKRSLYDDPEKANLIYERADEFFTATSPLTPRNAKAP